ncbi:uncharacterized protein K452DRAFT_285973 [Aplosporella prunicola CBS 121167]|uniref:MARVEL domain-containing protein n=1 Tax=Aplosporella prunicola CBS 121167 TaxID=1176127 RepID=A0A6A6BN06_9PEZI|nr:uncharacterized protein K452DRAFT_285973 [Aplosporella prunicola CBS 121167]KAF2143931.1 hypothetical protein K452DRAFT_285973 [Aplosporella prunicola CBS 121167]
MSDSAAARRPPSRPPRPDEPLASPSYPLSFTSTTTPTPHRVPFTSERTPSPSPRFPFSDDLDHDLSHSRPETPRDFDDLEDEPLSPAVNRHLSTAIPPRYACSRFSDDHSAMAEPKTHLATPIHWTLVLKWVIGGLNLILSASAAIVVGHSLSLYGGEKLARTIDVQNSNRPTWPSGLNLIPSWLLLAVAFVSTCCSVMTTGLALRRRFIKPVTWLEGFRLGVGIFFIGAWIASLIVFKLFETADSGDSLGRWACDNASDKVRGKKDYNRVCTEQDAGFALAVVNVVLEALLIACFAAGTFLIKKQAADDSLDEKRAGKSPV